MRKSVLLAMICWIGMSAVSWAQSWEIDLSAGSESATGGIHYRHFVDTGFIKLGATGLYNSDDDATLRLGSLDFLAGSDTLSPGLTIEIGLKGIFGNCEKNQDSGNIGNVGFAGNIEYFFTPKFSPLPIEAFGMITWAPEALSFQDARDYFEFTLGAGVRIGRYASVRLSYSIYNLEMKNEPDWDLSTNSFRLGLVLRF